jgi:hypothetical protein
MIASESSRAHLRIARGPTLKAYCPLTALTWDGCFRKRFTMLQQVCGICGKEAGCRVS